MLRKERVIGKKAIRIKKKFLKNLMILIIYHYKMNYSINKIVVYILYLKQKKKFKKIKNSSMKL